MSEFECTSNVAAFDATLAGGTIVIAKFQTKACVVCRRLGPGLRQLVERSAEPLRIVEVDAETVPDLAARYQVRGVPTLILFIDGAERDRCIGFQSTSMLREWVPPHLGTA